MKRFREINEDIDPDNGHAPHEITWLDATRVHPVGDPETLIAFHHKSVQRVDGDCCLDHGHILRRPGEHPEAFYRRALQLVSSPPGTKWGHARHDARQSTLDHYLSDYQRFPHMPSGINIRRMGLPRVTTHHLHPIYRS